MTWVEALILGIVQGLTEFLPVSSSGHIELGTILLNIQSNDNLRFSIAVHGATALSTIVVFRSDLAFISKELLKGKWNESTKFVAYILFSMIPVGIVGVFFEDQVESFFGGKVLLVASMLMTTAVFLTATYFYKGGTGKLSFTKAITIGVAQAFAIIPGISRSGATIATALILGIERSLAARFSFLMVLIPILGAAFLKILEVIQEPAISNSVPVFSLGVGFVAAFITGLLACSWMIQIVKKGKLIYFAGYCVIVATIALYIYW